MKSLKKNRRRMPSSFTVDGKSIRDKKNILMAFDHYFVAIGDQLADSLCHTQ